MEVDVREHPVMALQRQRVLTDEERLVALEAEHAIPGSYARKPGVGADAYHGGVKVHARLGVPAGIKRWIERQAMMRDRDTSDAVGAGGVCVHGRT